MVNKAYIYLRYASFLNDEHSGKEVEEYELEQAREYALRSIKSNINDANDTKLDDMAREIQLLLNSYFSGTSSETMGLSEAKRTEIDELMQKIIEEKLGVGITYDPQTGSAKVTRKKLVDTKDRVKKIVANKKQYSNTISKKVDALLKQLLQIPEKKRGSALNSALRQMNILWESLVQEIQKAQEQSSNKTVLLNELNGYEDFVHAFNTVLELAYGLNNSQLAGVIGEYLTALILLACDDSTTNVADQVEKAVVGDSGRAKKGVPDIMIPKLLENDPQFLKDVFGPQMAKEVLNVNEETTTVYTNAKKSQNKVDVQLVYKNTPITASVKNIDLSRRYRNSDQIVSVVSGTPILTLLNNDAAFFGDYLNIASEHQRTPHENISPFEVPDPVEPMPHILAKAHNTIKELMLIRGVAGGQMTNTGAKTATADFFILHDSSKTVNSFIVIPVATLIKKVIQHRDDWYVIKGKEKQTVKTMDPKTNAVITTTKQVTSSLFDSPTFQFNINNYANMTDAERIAHIYNQFIKQRISIKLSSRVFTG